jgi:hypothetical protein
MQKYKHSLINQVQKKIAKGDRTICSQLKIEWQESNKRFWVEFSPPEVPLKEGGEIPYTTLGKFCVTTEEELLEFVLLLIQRLEVASMFPIDWRSLVNLSSGFEPAAMRQAIYSLTSDDQIDVDDLPCECEPGDYISAQLEKMRMNPDLVAVTLDSWSGNYLPLSSFVEPKENTGSLAIFSEAQSSEIEYDFTYILEELDEELERFLLCKEHNLEEGIATFSYDLNYTCWLMPTPESLKYLGNFSQDTYYRLLEENKGVTFKEAAIAWMKLIAKTIRTESEYYYSDFKEDWRKAKFLIKGLK